ncbi:sulfite exporter TauE/SafE family protein [Nitrosopumilus sp.]|uniref:sulfite exporter TauE/SafE family protein n=1 Tax=Nitrosopumilus sp. TaxID=2024843 RepID=UPI00292D7740|nr:sulfite exporter TauE/SafE family protein [Nitrosopumilus sp.]
MPVEIILDPFIIFPSIISGVIVGFSLGLIGGGGSVLAVPLLLYVVGIKDTHLAIGTSALAVGIIAGISILNHKKLGNIQIKKGLLFAIPGIVGTLLGAQLGLWTPSENLLLLFAGFMAVVGFLILRKNTSKHEVTNGNSNLILISKNVSLSGFSVGMLAGYFGIGGGFLIVPTIMYSGGLNIIQAIGTSLVSVSSFGITIATRYFVADQVDLFVALLLIIGGVTGGYFGAKTSEKIPKEKLSKVFAVLLFTVATYIVIRTMAM